MKQYFPKYIQWDVTSVVFLVFQMQIIDFFILLCAHIVIIGPCKVTLFIFIYPYSLPPFCQKQVFLYICILVCNFGFRTPSLILCEWYWAMYPFSFLPFFTTHTLQKFFYVIVCMLSISSTVCTVHSISLSTPTVMNAHIASSSLPQKHAVTIIPIYVPLWTCWEVLLNTDPEIELLNHRICTYS